MLFLYSKYILFTVDAYAYNECERISLLFYCATACYARTVLPRPFCPSVCPFVRLSNECIVIKRKKLVPTFLYYILQFSDKKNGWSEGGDPLYLKF